MINPNANDQNLVSRRDPNGSHRGVPSSIIYPPPPIEPIFKNFRGLFKNFRGLFKNFRGLFKNFRGAITAPGRKNIFKNFRAI